MLELSVQDAIKHGSDLTSAGQITEAVRYFEAAVAQHPNSLDLQLQLANLLTDSGLSTRALPIYQKILAALPIPGAAVQSNYGIALYKSGHLTEAIAWLQRAVSKDSENVSAQSVLLMAMVDAGRIAEACERGKRMLQEKDARALRLSDPSACDRVRARVASLDWRSISSKPRVIAISLWGDQPKYLDGMMTACALAARFYPGWKIRVYLDDTVPAPFVSKLIQSDVEIVRMPIPRNRQLARLWRFMVADDPGVGFFLCRDCDSPIIPKEANAVAEWVRSKKPFHIMRDHPYHAELILAGMWGGVAGLLPPLSPKIREMEAIAQNPLDLWTDQNFLAEQVWPFVRDAAFVHDTPFRFGGGPLSEVDVATGIRVDAPLEWGYCRHGIMVWQKSDETVGKSLREYGEWSEATVALLSSHIARGDVVVEAGSNVGAHALALARATGTDGRLIAFEPNTEDYRLLLYNVGINGLHNIDVRSCALGTPSSQTSNAAPVHCVPQSFGASSTAACPRAVEFVSLDGLNLDRLNLLKLNLRDHALEAFRGAEGSIARFRPHIYLEDVQRECAEALIGYIRQFGYQLWWHVQSPFDAANWRGRRVDVFSNTRSINMLCVQPGQTLPPELQLEQVIDGSPSWPTRVA